MAQNLMNKHIINRDDEVYDTNRNPIAQKVESNFYQFLTT